MDAFIDIFLRAVFLENLAPVSYTHLTLPTMRLRCRSRGSPAD